MSPPHPQAYSLCFLPCDQTIPHSATILQESFLMILSPLFSFPRTAITKCQKRGLSHRNSLFHGHGGQKSRLRGQWVVFEGCQGEWVSGHCLPAPGGLQTIFGVPGFVETSLCLHLHLVFSLCGSLCPYFLSMSGHQSNWIRTHPDDITLI